MEYWIPVLAAIGAALAAFWRTKANVDEKYLERLETRLEHAEVALERARQSEEELGKMNRMLERQNAELRVMLVDASRPKGV